MGKIRVVIVDDSSLARELIRELLDGENDMEVVGEAENGLQAVELASKLMPNLITMDLEMPIMNGMDAIQEIMCSKAVPILVVSGVADAHNALEAIGRGALEVVNKPDFSPEQSAEFVAKVRMLAGVSVITRLRPRKVLEVLLAKPVAIPPTPIFPQIPPFMGSTIYSRVFAIACSTGGPQALAQILPALPVNFPSPVVIAQHISDGFAGGMVDWLGSMCKLPVRLAAEGDLLQAGVIHISPSEHHLIITPDRRAELIERGAMDVYRPSCDALFNSIAAVFGRQAIGIILTGMGSDGAKGIAAIRDQGGMTLAQDETTSVIYGMNRVAVDSGAVQQVLPVAAIASTMVALARPMQVKIMVDSV